MPWPARRWPSPDFTGDGRLDVVTKIEWSVNAADAYRVYLYAQTASGGLEERARLATSQTAPVGILGFATADFNADGLADVAVPTGAGLDLFFQRDGTLGGRINIDAPGARQVDAADLDGDGRPDPVVAGDAGVSVLRATGPSTFGSPTSFTSRRQIEIEVGDVKDRLTPVPVPALSGMQSVAAGLAHSIGAAAW